MALPPTNWQKNTFSSKKRRCEGFSGLRLILSISDPWAVEFSCIVVASACRCSLLSKRLGPGSYSYTSASPPANDFHCSIPCCLIGKTSSDSYLQTSERTKLLRTGIYMASVKLVSLTLWHGFCVAMRNFRDLHHITYMNCDLSTLDRNWVLVLNMRVLSPPLVTPTYCFAWWPTLLFLLIFGIAKSFVNRAFVRFLRV